MIEIDWPKFALWMSVAASGLYHGVNPTMGWPLAVSSGLMERHTKALFFALLCLATGHVLAMFVIMAPFAMLTTLMIWNRQIQIGASMLIIGFGFLLLLRGHHSRVVLRIPPSRLVLWSFAIAIAHGAGLMLVPVYLGLCQSSGIHYGHLAAQALINANLAMALLVSTVHASAMMAAGGFLAWLVYRYVGLKLISRSWFNLDTIWAMSIVLVGMLELSLNLFGPDSRGR